MMGVALKSPTMPAAGGAGIVGAAITHSLGGGRHFEPGASRQSRHKHRMCVSVGRRLAGALHFGRFGPPEKIIGEAGKSLVEHQSGLSNRFSFRRQ